MKAVKTAAILSLLLFILLYIAACAFPVEFQDLLGLNGADVTRNVKVIGNIKDHISPSKSQNYAYARNIWDLQVYKDKIFIGYGSWANSSLSGATNCGTIPIIAVDTKTEKIVREDVYCIDRNRSLVRRANGAEDEQLWNFSVIDGELYVPGCDARGTFDTGGGEWDWGNFYVRRSDGTWLKKRRA